jgi:hypothetical protein
MTSRLTKLRPQIYKGGRFLTVNLIAMVAMCASLHAQTFSSGSNGSDGALNLTTPGTYLFDPNDVTTFGRVLNPAGDGIYNFTTINIASGVTLKIPASKVNLPIFWLASGAVTIAGTIDLSGQGNMPFTNTLDQRRVLSIPGAGGYAGGAGGGGSTAAQAGQGPGGGAAASTQSASRAGTFSGNRFLVPLVGGAGGGGGFQGCGGSPYAPAGGAGGGAIAIISSVSINFSDGTVLANGGDGTGNCGFNSSGGGGGGAIRLVAPLVGGRGTLQVAGGNGVNQGQVRVEAFQQQFSFSVAPSAGQLSVGSPFNTFVPTSSVRVVSVNGVALPSNPIGSFTLPDVTISQTQPVTLNIQATNVPLGTIVNLEVFSENPNDNSVVDQVVASTPLAGQTAALSTATASVTFPSGFSRCWVRATWTQ